MRYRVQVITMPDTRYKEYCNSSDFIREHIFPGGHLPSMGAMSACAAASGLAAVRLSNIGPHYAITLREWRKNWIKHWDAIQKLGYPQTFMRKYALAWHQYVVQGNLFTFTVYCCDTYVAAAQVGVLLCVLRSSI